MSRRRLSHFVLCLAPTLPLASMACGSGFRGETGGSGEEADAGAAHVAFGDGSAERDSATHDAGAADGRRDGAGEDAKAADREGVPEATAPEASGEASAEEGGRGCPAGMLTCEDGGCVPNDAHNCGACGVACSGGTPVCDGTQCVSGCPASKPTLCDGTCVDLTSDPANCGKCGNACGGNPPDSQVTCSSGACGFACDAGYEQCGSSCLLAVPDTVHGVFVAQGGPTSGCGTPDVPCGTITSALRSIWPGDAGTKNIVYIAESAAPYGEIVTLVPVPGLTLEGGWVNEGAGRWTHACALDPSQVVIEPPAGYDSVVQAATSEIATLRTLTILNAPSAPAAGQSLYGLQAIGSNIQITLDNVQIRLGEGGAGTDGSAGPATPGTLFCGGTGNANPGAPGGPGVPGPNGTYSASGFQVGAPGGIGFGGGAGDFGGPGQPGGTCTPTLCKPLSVACSIETGLTLSGAAGSPGCGGNGGQGGSGGTGGGSSIAVFAWGAGVQVNITGSSLLPGYGGAGGNGGPGSPGAPGAAGAAGASKTCGEHECSGTACVATASTTASGGAGGSAGGTGGQGGTGGGGAGGDSYCYYTGGGATVTGSFQCETGLGGAGGAPNGVAGRSAPHD